MKNHRGFTLIEVMIALAIFSVFIGVFVTSQGHNVSDSARFKEELTLRTLAEIKINEIIVSPPELSEQLALTPQTGEFDDLEGYENYSYSVTYRSFKIPDLSKIQGESGQQQDGQMAELERRLFTTVKENMEKLLWQIEVLITNKTTSETYNATTWIYHREAQVRFNVN